MSSFLLSLCQHYQHAWHYNWRMKFHNFFSWLWKSLCPSFSLLLRGEEDVLAQNPIATPPPTPPEARKKERRTQLPTEVPTPRHSRLNPNSRVHVYN